MALPALNLRGGHPISNVASVRAATVVRAPSNVALAASFLNETETSFTPGAKTPPATKVGAKTAVKK